MTRIEALAEAIKARLIDDWKRCLRLWSVRIHAAALAFLAIYELVPAVPAEVQALIPSQYRAPLIGLYALAGIAARIIKQKGAANG